VHKTAIKELEAVAINSVYLTMSLSQGRTDLQRSHILLQGLAKLQYYCSRTKQFVFIIICILLHMGKSHQTVVSVNESDCVLVNIS